MQIRSTFFTKLIAAMLFILFSGMAVSAQTKVTNARLWEAPDHTRLVLELSKAVEHKVMVLSNPDRLVLDIKNASKKSRFDSLDFSHSPIKSIRSARRNKHDLRIVLDLKEKTQPKSFLLKSNGQYGDRLVVDLYAKNKKKAAKKITHKKTIKDAAIKLNIIVVITT